MYERTKIFIFTYVHTLLCILFMPLAIIDVFSAENTQNTAFFATSDKTNAQNRGISIYTLKSKK